MKRFLLSPFALAFLSVSAEAANRFLTCTTACTITAADTSIWGAASGGTGASVPGSGDAVILDTATCVGGTTCTMTMGPGYNPTWQSLTMGTCTASTTGCILDVATNDNNITLTSSGNALSVTGTGTRRLDMGDGTWTFSSTINPILDFTTTTNLTFNRNGSTIAFSAPSFGPTINTGGLIFNNMTVTGHATNTPLINITGAGSTWNNITVSGGFANVVFPVTGTTAIASLNITGTSTKGIRLSSSGSSSVAALNITAASIQWAAISFINSTSSISATNSLDLGSNTNVTITPPSGGGRIIGG
jgi:hypothetical protein